MNHYIYLLRNPLDNSIFYIGHSVVKPATKLSLHINEAKTCLGRNKQKDTIIKNILSFNEKPIMEIIESVSAQDWEVKEKYFISLYKQNNHPLVNIALGGRTTLGMKMSEVGKLNLSKAKKGQRYNRIKPSPRRVLTDEQVLEIRIKRKVSTLKELSKEYGVSENAISAIARYKRYRNAISNEPKTNKTA